MNSYVVTKSINKNDTSEWIVGGEAKTIIQFYVKTMLNDPESIKFYCGRKAMRVIYPDGDRYYIFRMN